MGNVHPEASREPCSSEASVPQLHCRTCKVGSPLHPSGHLWAGEDDDGDGVLIRPASPVQWDAGLFLWLSPKKIGR